MEQRSESASGGAQSTRRMRWSCVALLTALFLGVQVAVPYNAFWDDSFISLTYARNLARGVGPVFLPPDAAVATEYSRVEGYSNPLWTAAMAVLSLPPGSSFVWIRLLGLAAALGLWLAARGLLLELFDRDAGDAPPEWVTWMPALLLTLHQSLATYVKSGMESVAFTALVVCGLWHTARLLRGDGTRGHLANALLWVTVALTRPEGALYLAAPAGVLLLWTMRRKHPARSFALWLGCIAGCGALFLAWRIAYYGDWLPNTYRAKVGVLVSVLGRSREDLLRHGVWYVDGFLGRDLPWAMAAFSVIGLVLPLGTRREVKALIVSAIALNVFFAVWVGGDPWPGHRFLHVTVALVAVLAALPLARVIRFRGRALPRGLAMVDAVVLIALQPSLGLLVQWTKNSLRTQTWLENLVGVFTVDEITPTHVLGLWLRERVAHDEVIATGQAGQIPYYSERETVDLLGLNDREIAKHWLSYDYLRERRVGYVVDVLQGTEQSPSWLFPQLIADAQFQQDFVLTHRFEGRQRNGMPSRFVLFTRRDLAGPEFASAAATRSSSLRDHLARPEVQLVRLGGPDAGRGLRR